MSLLKRGVLRHNELGEVGAVSCNVLNAYVVVHDATLGRRVSALGQKSVIASTHERPRDCPLTEPSLESRRLANCGACLGCNFGVVEPLIYELD